MKDLELYLYNTLTKRKDHFIPEDLKHARLYVCGPTVYERPHIGNIRAAVIYDLLYRMLKFIFPKTTYVRNFTDIDDKIINACLTTGKSVHELTNSMIHAYENDVEAVLCLKPDYAPCATHHLQDMIAMIQRLIDNGHAYIAEGHVLFSVLSYPQYGLLSRQKMDDIIVGARIEVAKFKKNPADFVLWKPFNKGEEEFSFESPWGKGRPGWHIECSAMSTKFFGCDFDIHGGGIDLLFPHHENEIAQAVCANKDSSFAKFWMHNGFLTIDGEKMSKSLNNVILLRDLLDQDIPGAVIRYFYFMTHYRKPIDYNKNAIHSAGKSLRRMADIIEPLIAQYDNDLTACDTAMEKALCETNGSEIDDMMNLLCNDLNTPGLLAKIFVGRPIKSFGMMCTFLGFKPSVLHQYKHNYIDPNIIEIANEREEAKAGKDWLIADALRSQIIAHGYNIMDQKNGGYELIKI